jgi:hypothetical protein
MQCRSRATIVARETSGYRKRSFKSPVMATRP